MNRLMMPRHPVTLVMLAIAALFLLTNVFVIVPEEAQGVLMRFSSPVGTFNRYHAGEATGHGGAGLSARIPLVDSVIWIDKRVQAAAMQPVQIISANQQLIKVDAEAHYRITDPVRMVGATQNEVKAMDRIGQLLAGSVRAEMDKQATPALLSPEHTALIDAVRGRLARDAASIGAQIVDVRITGVMLPEGGQLDATLERMRGERLAQANTIRAQGDQDALTIKNAAAAKAATIYAAAYGKDPGFADFYRAMQSYRRTLEDGRTTILLGQGSDYMRQFEAAPHGR